MSFYDVLKQYEGPEIRKAMDSCTRADVEAALAAPEPLALDHLVSLLSPAAGELIEDMAQRAHNLTQQRFGKTVSLFAPVYLSNECINRCVYCGFNANNKVERLSLTPDQAVEEGRLLHAMGFRNLLLVSGEAPHIVSTAYMADVVDRLRPLFPSVSIEIYPMETAAYAELIAHGVDGLVVFQETYDEELYATLHPAGRKRDFRWRLETPDRGGEAGFRRLGLGALLGLADWRVESFFLGLHARYLMHRYWKSSTAISFPRIQPAAGGFQPLQVVSDFDMVQMLTALRLFLPDTGMVLSTREAPEFRDNLIPLGITSMSAGSKTEPGGYAHEKEAGAQFEIADPRSPQAVAKVIAAQGYEPVWKDWDAAFLQ
jgi:2-iminoacetate synthase